MTLGVISTKSLLVGSFRACGRQTDRLTDKQINRRAGRQADRRAGRQAGRQRDRQTDRQTDTGFSLPFGRKSVLYKGTAYRLCLLAGLFSSVGRASAYKAESRGFKSRRSPLFLPLSFHHSYDAAVSFPPSYTNQAGLGLVAPNFINHFVDWGAIMCQTDRQTDRRAGRQAGRQAERQTDRQTDWQGRQTDRQMDVHV